MIAGKFTCPQCGSHFELSTTKAPAQQSEKAYVTGGDLNGKVSILIGQIMDGVMMGQPLDNSSSDFFNKTKERLEMCEEKGWEIRMTDKQMKFLKSLAAKAGVD